jgi:transmembrane sensor
MIQRKRPEIDAVIYETAADWLVQNRTGPRDDTAFDAWLRASPLHIEAYIELSAVWDDTAQLPLISARTPEELIQFAITDTKVIPLDVPGDSRGSNPRPAGPPPSSPRSRRFSSRRPLLAAAVLAACLCCGLWFWSARGRLFATALGEQRTVALSDGSTVDLDTRTQIKVHYSSRQRTVDLIEGQALFRVAKNASKPFVVQVSGVSLRAVGTEFDVYRRPTGLIVTVLEGRIAATANPNGGTKGSQPAVLVTAGEQLNVMSSGFERPTTANIAAAVAWTQHRLIFEETPLAEVVAQFNRYNSRQLIIDDPTLASLHISGVFSSYDPTALVQFLRLQPEVAIRESHEQVHITGR